MPVLKPGSELGLANYVHWDL